MNINDDRQSPEYNEMLDKVYEKERNGFFGFFIEKYRLVYLLIGIIFLAGLYAIFTMPKESEPEIAIPYAMVNTMYPGANPEDVELFVTDKIEEKIENLDELKTYTSSSNVGLSSIFVEFSAEADIDKSIQELKDVVDSAKSSIANEAEDPVVTELNIADYPVLTYSLFGDFSDSQLKNYADIVQSKLEGISGVSRVPILGGVEREFQVLLDQKKIASYKLSVSQIVSAISSSNINIPSGSIEIDEYQYNVRVKGQFEKITDLGDVVVTNFKNTPIFLRDVAEVADTYKDAKTQSLIGFSGGFSQNAISLQIYIKTGGNIIETVNDAEEIVSSLNSSNQFPTGLEILKTNDNAQFILDDIKTLGKSGLQTMILIVLFLFAVLGIRGAMITGFSVPIAFFVAFTVLNGMGMTINGIVLFSLVLSLGLMVDNSIIVMEGITEYITTHNKTPKQASLLAIWNYRWPIISGTMTTVCAFVPMLLVSGIMGEYIGIIPKTVSVTLIASLFTALIIIPTLAARKYKKINGKNNETTKKHRSVKINQYLEKLKVKYIAFLRSILPHKKKRRRMIGLAFGLFLIVSMLPVVGLVKVEMFPSLDIDYFVVNVKLPDGAVLGSTLAVASEAEKIILEIPELENYVLNAGAGFSFQGGAASSENLANFTVNLSPTDDRDRKSYEITDELRPRLELIPGGDITIEELSGGPPTGQPVDVRLYGKDLAVLGEISDQYKNILENIDGTLNVDDTLEESTGEVVYYIDRDKAKLYGLDSATIAMSIRQSVYGAQSSTVSVDGDDIDITVKYRSDTLQNVDDLSNIMIPTFSGQNVLLSEVATVSFEPSVKSISHYEGERVVRVTSAASKTGNVREIIAEFNSKIEQIALPEGYTMEIGGETEDIEKSFTEMFLSMILAVLLIFIILVLQFNSYKQPFIIIFALPLAIIGAIVGLMIMRLPFSIPAFIGIVALSGIVVNDAIVLIDRINKNLARGVRFIDGIIEAGIARMKPIFLTSATTIAGIFPLTFTNEMWRGLGFSVIFGLLFATVLTLVFVPILYAGFCRKDYDKSKINE
jgi:multidrug efflux pump subunit AcrB